jgi:pimeloyl-ACP methyl ester carboxylesterase
MALSWLRDSKARARAHCRVPGYPHRHGRERRAARAAAGLLAVALLAAACAGGSGRRESATTTAATPVTLPLEQPARRCGPPHDRAVLLRFASSDGVQLSGAMVGGGAAGVVLVHQYPADLCGFWPYAVYLARKGLRVLDLDVRCYGRSSCPDGDARGHVGDDVTAAVAELRRQGATRVALVGASMGATAALVAGAVIRPPVAAVVSLSGERDLTKLIGLPLNAGTAVPHLVSPTMYVVAVDDSDAPVEETRAMYRATGAADKRIMVLSGADAGRHGWDLLSDYQDHWTPVAAKVAAFVLAHTNG